MKTTIAVVNQAFETNSCNQQGEGQLIRMVVTGYCLSMQTHSGPDKRKEIRINRGCFCGWHTMRESGV
jgi:hypothetical protein